MGTPHVVVVGSVNVDLIVSLPKLPGPGETVTGGELQRELGGKGANAAVAAARLGAQVALVAAVGTDADSRAVREDLYANGVDDGSLVATLAPTGLATVLTDPGGENAIAVASGANHLLDADDVRRGLARAGADTASIVIVDLEIPDAAVRAAAEHCRDAGCRMVLDPGPARPLPPAVLAATTVLTPNRVELSVLTQGGGDPAALLELGVGAVVVTLGSGGVDLHRAGEETLHVPAFPVQVRDSTGAGDAFAAGLAVALAEQAPLAQAVRVGAATGALTTRALGARAALPARGEVDALLAAHPG